jgi:hypothetical protein
VIRHLLEIERRRLYAEEGYASLFEFCTGALKYSGGSASRRINAMRLLREHPEIETSLREGSLSVSTASEVHTFTRDAGCSREAKAELIEQVKDKSKIECLKLFRALDPERAPQIQIEVSPELYEEIQRVWALTGHQNHSIQETLQWMTTEIRKRLEKKVSPPAQDPQATPPAQEAQSTPPADEAGQQRSGKSARLDSRAIPAEMRRAVWTRDQGRCRFVDAKSGRRCNSSYALEIDHITPYAKGGLTELRNLRLLCRTHNWLQAIRSFGVNKMARYWGPG